MADYLPLTALKAFEVTARHGSFSKAAEELHVTTGAVSQQIKSLEDILGVKLFHRLHRGLELTEAARVGLPMLTSGFINISAAMQKMREYEAHHALRVWVAPSFASQWLVPRLKHFMKAYPNSDLRLISSSAMIGSGHGAELFLAQSFYQKDIDVGIFFGQGEFKGYCADQLFSVELVPLCHPNLVHYGEHRLRTPQDLIHHSLLHDDTAYEGRPDWAGWLKQAGVTDVNPHRGIRFNHVSMALEAAVEGQGVALGMKQLAQHEIDKGNLVVPFELSMPLKHAYYIVSLEETADIPAIRDFREWIKEQAESV